MLVAPSMLSADFGKLAQESIDICEAGADYLHIDIMDGHFVPNLTFGPLIVESIKKHSNKPLDIHLMVKNIPFFIDLYATLKPEFLSFHIEEDKHPHRQIQKIRSLGIKPGIVLCPHTSEESVKYLLPEVDLVLLMSVNPGFGGQSFIESTFQKIENIKKLRDKISPKCIIEVDGGVSDKNISKLKEKGVDMVVAGNYIF